MFTLRSEVSAHASKTWWYQASLIGDPSKMFSLSVALKIHAWQEVEEREVKTGNMEARGKRWR